MTVVEAAKKLGVSGQRVRQWVSDGTLKAVHINPRMLDVNTISVNALVVRRENKRLARESKKGGK